MESSWLNHLDRTTARSPLRGTTSSIPGLLGTLLMIGLLLWLYIPEIIYYLAGKYYQSNFEIQQPPYTRIDIPKELKAAIVFNNNTNQKIANHSLLAQQATFKAYLTQTGAQKFEAVQKCDPNYFSNTINPITLEDCFIFPANSQIDFSYYSYSPTSFGFTSEFACRDPFFCRAGTTFYTSVQNNYTQIFSNYSFTLYFTSTIISPDGQVKDQLFNISSSQWNTPLTITAQAGVELQLTNITIDESIFPWKIIRMLTTTSFSGNLAGTAVASTSIYTTPPRAYFFNSHYQNQSYRYYQKLDLLLGIIGGGMFLIYIILFVPFHYINQCIFHMRAANETLIEINIRETPISHSHFQEVNVSKWYMLQRLLPWKQNEHIRELKRILDIGQLIKMIKVAEKNNKKAGIQRYNKDRKLKLQQESQQQIFEKINPQDNSIEQIRQSRDEGVAVQELERERTQNPLLSMNRQQKEDLSKRLNIKLCVLEAIIHSPESAHLLAANPTVLALCNQIDSLNKSMQDLGYDRYKRPSLQTNGLIKNCCDNLVKFVRWFDFFGVRPQFNPGGQSSSLCGLLVTLIVLGLTILFCISAMAGANDTQVMVAYDFQSPEEINYSITTSKIMRPMICFSSSTASNAITSTSPTINLTFYATSTKGTVSRPWAKPSLEQILELGIEAGSPYFNVINRANCFIMPNDQVLEMGGLGTDHEAYFGFRFSPYCSGTASYCQSINSTLRSTFLSWINSSPATLYLPISRYSQDSQSIVSGGVYPQPIREGTSSFPTTSAVEETLYVDQMRLLDSASKRFLGIQPPLIQQTITASQYQQAANVRGIVASLPYYEVRVRPSGRVINVYLKATTIDFLLGIIGGIATIFWGLFHCFGKTYNHFNIRLTLAKQVYSEQQSPTFMQKLWAVYRLPVFCCFSQEFKSKVDYLHRLDKKLEFDLYAIEIIKQTYSMYYLSTGEYKSLQQKHAALIYLKQKIGGHNTTVQEVEYNQLNRSNTQIEYQFEGYDILEQEQSSSNRVTAGNQVSNQFQLQRVQVNGNDESIARLATAIAEEIDEIQPYDKHRGPFGTYKQKWREKLAYLDWFNTKPEFTLQGQWRIKSVFGACLSFGMIACILLMFTYYISIFHTTQNQIISHQRKIQQDIANSKPLALSPDIFGLLIGFYQKPNSTLLNVDSFMTSNVAVAIEQVTLTRNSNGLLSRSINATVLTKCPSNYFDGFKDNNTDYSFLDGVTNGYCLPSNVTLQLSSISSNPLQYFRIRIYNRTSASASTSALSNLVNNYQVGLLMTVPVIDIVNRRFQYSVQQIRGFSNPATRSIEYNITLSKQKITFTTPNYTIHPQSQSIETYNYNHNKYDQRFYSLSSSTAPRQYNITMSYQGYIDEYTVTYDHFGKLFGLAGGIIALYFCAVSLLAQSFNSFKMKYLLAKELYLLNTNSEVKSRSKASKKRKVQKEINIYFNELQLFLAWFLPFPAQCCDAFPCSNTLVTINILVKKVESDLDFISFFKKYRDLKDTINKKYRLRKNTDILASNLFVKLPFVALSAQNSSFDLSQEDLSRYAVRYDLNSYLQIKIRHLLTNKVALSKIFNHQDIIKAIQKNIIFQEEGSGNKMRPEAIDTAQLLNPAYEMYRSVPAEMKQAPSLINVQMPDSNEQRPDSQIDGALLESKSQKKSEKPPQQPQQQIAKDLIKNVKPIELIQDQQET